MGGRKGTKSSLTNGKRQQEILVPPEIPRNRAAAAKASFFSSIQGKMAFTASTACKPSLLLSPRASSSSSSSSPRTQALLCRSSSSTTRPTLHGLSSRAVPAFAAPAPAPRRRAASTGIVCGKVTKGSAAPNFTLKDQDGKSVSLSKFKGKPVVLYFYPADETPGCTKQSLAMATPSQESIEEASKKQLQEPSAGENGGRTWALIGGITVGVAVALAFSVDAGPAMALGPEGPLVEEFWDNMRRYALYALTVSTGFAWALVQPIVELLKSPITAVLIIVVIASGGVLVSQVINAMAGNSDFIYMYEQ